MRRALLTSVAVLIAFAAPACGSDDGEEPAATRAPVTEPETIPEETRPDRSAERARLLVAPVLSSGGCPPDLTVPEVSGDEGTAPEAGTDGSGAEADAGPGGPYPTADGVFCYTVGEPVADGNDLTDATLAETDGEWQVLSRIEPDATDKLNELFNACHVGEPACPAGPSGNGAAAIIWEGIVLHAPAIQVEDLADGPISLAGGLTERRARDLITIINR